MGDIINPEQRTDSIRGLVQDISEQLDAMSNALRADTIYADIRRSDAKTFMLISRHPRGLAQLAKALGISRQAAHRSLHRLIDAGLVQYELAEGSRRNRITSLTEAGREAQQTGRGIGATIDARIADAIGPDKADALRDLLKDLHTHL